MNKRDYLERNVAIFKSVLNGCTHRETAKEFSISIARAARIFMSMRGCVLRNRSYSDVQECFYSTDSARKNKDILLDALEEYLNKRQGMTIEKPITWNDILVLLEKSKAFKTNADIALALSANQNDVSQLTRLMSKAGAIEKNTVGIAIWYGIRR